MKFRHIRSKIAIFMLSASVISLLICWTVNFFYFNDTINKQVISDNMAIVQKAADRVKNDLVYIKDYVATMSYDESLIMELKRYYAQEGFPKYSAENRLQTKASSYLVLGKNLFANLYIVNHSDTMDISNMGKFDDLIKEPWYKDLAKRKRDGFTADHDSMLRAASHMRFHTVSYVKTVSDGEFRTLGRIVADLDLTRLFADLETAGESARAYYVVDKNGNTVYTKSAEKLNTDKLNMEEGVQLVGENYYISVPVEGLNYRLISVLPKATMNQAMFGSTLTMVLSLLTSLLIAGVFSLVLSKSITKPILCLGKGMQESVRNNFDIALPISGKDELSEMTDIFNRVQQETRELMREKKEMSKRDRELRIKYFMSKINPHFIYNTLNCLIYLARKNQGEEIISLTRALIAVLKTNIRVGESPIPLRDEVEYLTNYFCILKYRYNDEIHIEFDIDEGAIALYIQPMILYPIVENSVFHGIAPAGRSGTVRVCVLQEEDKIVFSVWDDGIGMDEDKIKEIEKYLCSQSERSIYGSIGLKNANDRLRLLYPSCKGLEISGDSGTRVSFSIEKKELRQSLSK